MKKYLTLFSLLCSLQVFASTKEVPAAVHMDCLTYDCSRMADIREDIQQGNQTYMQAWLHLRKSADAALQHKPYSVVDKTLAPASGNRHDYFSFGPYWWPNPDTPDHLPYIRKDGKINPSSKTGDTDSKRMVQFSNDVRTLSLAWFYSGKPEYAKKAVLFLHTWFLDEKTRMNPNLNYAQAIPGVVNGRGIGIIDTRVLIDVADSIRLLQYSGDISPSELSAYKDWYRNYTQWLLTSENGFEESNWHNNHGTWFDAQVTAFSLFTGDMLQAKKQIKIFELRHLSSQVNIKGELPAELERTRSFHYTNFALAAYARMGRYGELAGSDVWHFSLDDHSMKNAFKRVSEQVGGNASDWPYQDIKFTPSEAMGPVLAASRAWKDTAFAEKAALLIKEYPENINLLTPGSVLVK